MPLCGFEHRKYVVLARQLVENIARESFSSYIFANFITLLSSLRLGTSIDRDVPLLLFFPRASLSLLSIDPCSYYRSRFAIYPRRFERQNAFVGDYVTKRNGCFHYDVATSRRRNWLRGRYFATLHARRENTAAESSIFSQSFINDTLAILAEAAT